MSIAVFVIIIIMATAITSGNPKDPYVHPAGTGNVTTVDGGTQNETVVEISAGDEKNKEKEIQGAVHFAKITEALADLNLVSQFEGNCFTLSGFKKRSENGGKILKLELTFTQLDVVDDYDKPTVDVKETYDTKNAYLLSHGQGRNFSLYHNDDSKRASTMQISEAQTLKDVQNDRCTNLLSNTYNLTLGTMLENGLENETFPEYNITSGGSDMEEDERGRRAPAQLSRTQILVIATCSSVIGLFFITALSMRIRNYFRRLRREQEMAERPSFRSYTVALKHEPKRQRDAGMKSSKGRHGDTMNGDAGTKKHSKAEKNVQKATGKLPIICPQQQQQTEVLRLKSKPLSTNSFTSCDIDIPLSNSVSGEFADYSSITSTPFNQSLRSKASTSYNNREQLHNFTNGACAGGGHLGNMQPSTTSREAAPQSRSTSDLPPEATLDYAPGPEVSTDQIVAPLSASQSLSPHIPHRKSSF